MATKFSYSMQSDMFNAAPVSIDLINKALRLVFDDAVAGNFNFFVLSNDNNNHFAQTLFETEQGVWQLEYSKADGIIFQKQEPNFPVVKAFFESLFKGNEPDLSGFSSITLEELKQGK